MQYKGAVIFQVFLTNVASFLFLFFCFLFFYSGTLKDNEASLSYFYFKCSSNENKLFTSPARIIRMFLVLMFKNLSFFFFQTCTSQTEAALFWMSCSVT